jgi:hypothetical protein
MSRQQFPQEIDYEFLSQCMSLDSIGHYPHIVDDPMKSGDVFRVHTTALDKRFGVPKSYVSAYICYCKQCGGGLIIQRHLGGYVILFCFFKLTDLQKCGTGEVITWTLAKIVSVLGHGNTTVYDML